MPTRSAVVTGAARGIGLATVRRLLKAGCNVVAVDREAGAVEEAFGEGGERLATMTGDIADPATTERIKALAEARFGRVDILVNNAGISPKIDMRSPRLEEITLDEWDRTFSVNVRALLLTCQAFLPAMKAAGWGRVVNVSSLAGRTKSVVAGPTYSASKAAVLGFTRTVAAEYAPFGITVNAVAPGRIDTPMAALADAETNARYVAQIPAGRMGTADEIAAAIAYFAGEDSGFVTGVALDINGGFYMA